MSRAPDVTVRCVPGADLTAYAHGELPEARRAEVSRHLLRCPRCRAEAGASRDLFARLRAFGASGEDWRAEIAAAGAHRAAVLRPRRRLAVAASLAAASLVAFAGLAGREGSRGAGSAEAAAPALYRLGATLLPEDESALLQAQDWDGRWPAGGGARDGAATSLAVAALAARYGRDLGDDTVGQAVRAGVDWLLAHDALPAPAAGDEPGPAPAGGAEAMAARALATAALLEVHAATGDRALREPIERSLRALRNADRAALSGDSALRWAHRALSRARALGWEGLDPSVRRLEDWMGGGPRAAALGAEEDPSSMIATAMRMIARSPRG